MRKITIKEVQEMQLSLIKKLHLFLEQKSIPYFLIAGSALGAVRHNGFIPWDDDIDIGMFRKDYEKFLEISADFDNEYEIVNFKNSISCDFLLTRIYFKNTMIDDPSIKRTKLDKRLYFDIFPIDAVPEDAEERAAYESKIKKQKKHLAYMYARNFGNSSVAMLAKKAISIIYSPFRGHILKKADKLMRKYENVDSAFVCSLCSQYSFKKQVMLKSYYGTPTLHKFEDAEFYIPEQIDNYLTTLYGGDYMEIPPESKRRKGNDIYILDEE